MTRRRRGARFDVGALARRDSSERRQVDDCAVMNISEHRRNAPKSERHGDREAAVPGAEVGLGVAAEVDDDAALLPEVSRLELLTRAQSPVGLDLSVHGVVPGTSREDRVTIVETLASVALLRSLGEERREHRGILPLGPV